MIVKVPLRLAVPRMQPLTFAPPSGMNDSPQAQAKAEREALVILREMERYFGREKFKKLVQEISKGGQGNTPDEERNARIVAKYYLAPGNKSKAAREYVKEYPEEGNGPKAVRAVRQQLNRLLKDEQREAKKKAEGEGEFQEAVRYRGKSLLGEPMLRQQLTSTASPVTSVTVFDLETPCVKLPSRLPQTP
jgi:hypothetical protein